MSGRDDFVEPTKKKIAARVGYRCSNQTCRQPTSRPHPTNRDEAINTGVAAHITAASPGGPRFDPVLTPEERSSPENGIWLCQTCSKIIDSAPEAYSVELLRHWKQEAEQQAARAASLKPDIVGELLANVDAVRETLLGFVERWQVRSFETTLAMNMKAEGEEWDRQIRRHLEDHAKVMAAYDREVAPQIAELVTRCKAVLGELDPIVQHLEQRRRVASTNLLVMRKFANELEQVRSVLELR